MADGRIHVDAGPPYTLRYEMTSDEIDLSTVTAGAFEVTRGDGTLDEEPLDATIESQSETAITLVHPWDPDELPEREILVVTPVLTTPAGIIYGESRTVTVLHRSQL